MTNAAAVDPGLVLEGIRVLEVAEYGVGPSCGATLSDWGADVVKVERFAGDPVRIASMTGAAPLAGGFDMLTDLINRNKRSVALDLYSPASREPFERLVRWADVFVTAFMPRTREHLKVNPEDIFAINPTIVYARATGQGAQGPDTDQRAFDASAFWARSGLAWCHSPPDGPVTMPRPATGDLATGAHLAGGVAAALVRRLRTGQGGIVDGSLLATAVWMLGVDIGTTSVRGRNPYRANVGKSMRNPLLGPFTTADGRWLNLAMFQSQRDWPQFCRVIDHPELEHDERFATAENRTENRDELHKIVWEALASRELSHWRTALTEADINWAPVAEPIEVLSDPQVVANGYTLAHPNNPDCRLSATPVQFDETPITCRTPAPRVGAHTDEVLSELGYDDDAIAALRAAEAVR